MGKRQNILRKCLATAYEDKVKGVMDGEPFVLLSNQFKERDQLKEAQQKSRHNLEPSRNSRTVSYVLKGGRRPS